MKTIVLIYTINLFIFVPHNQDKKKQCEVIFTKNGIHKVYEKRSFTSNVIYEISNDTINENYFILILHKITKGWAEITAYSPLKEYNQKGWIPLSDIGILISDSPVLYKKPKRNSKKIKINKYDYNFLEILDCKNYWLKVKYSNKTGTYIGWLPPESQCANPYTTCN